jgi:hypothetical protein
MSAPPGGILAQAREELVGICQQQRLDRSAPVTVRPLVPDDAIGTGPNDEFAIRRGPERVIEAAFAGAKGQAFTAQPNAWEGPLEELLSLDLGRAPFRAVFVAGLNAVLRSLGVATGTIHCREDDLTRCGPVMAETVEARFGRRRIGLVGLQPAILKALASRFEPSRVRAVDLNLNNVGTIKSGVPIWDGATDLSKLVAWCDVCLATGSCVVNGTIDEIRECAESAGKPVVFYGNTISGVAQLTGLDHICPFGQ